MRRGLWLVGLWLSAPAVYGSGVGGGTAAEFQSPLGARAAGMAGTSGVLWNDLDALSANPAVVSPDTLSQALASFQSYSLDTQRLGLAYGQALTSKIYGALSLGQLTSADIERTQADGTLFSSRDYLQRQTSLVMGIEGPLWLPRGARLKYLENRFGDYRAEGAGADLGWRWGQEWRSALVWQNIGNTTLHHSGTSNTLPASVRGSVGWVTADPSGPLPAWRRDRANVGVNLLADLVVPLSSAERRTTWSLGGEAWFRGLLGFRAGLGDSQQVTLGASFRLAGYRFDYATSISGESPNIQRLALTAQWGSHGK